jgi:hypothetical protein
MSLQEKKIQIMMLFKERMEFNGGGGGEDSYSDIIFWITWQAVNSEQCIFHVK